ncbi:hypothetical protein [Hydrogenophaga sp. RWCD_12]|uniref:hypothetical protein n=1 Tax=Hydrogenophaga sp. RWCD_12 TaxID=3391190 RepID=UPI0039854452
MQDFAGPIQDGFLLVARAASHNIPLPHKERDLLFTIDASALRGDPQKCGEFLSAIEVVSRTLGVTAAEIRAIARRIDRLRPMVSNSLTLMDFAAENAKPISDDIRIALTDAASAIDSRSITIKQEQDFLKAYEKLTTTLAPITAETLEASTTRLPSFGEILNGFRRGNLPKWTLGRFLNVSILLLVLASTGLCLAYYYGGVSTLQSYRELQKEESRLKANETVARLDLAEKTSAFAAAQQRSNLPNASAADVHDLKTAKANLDRSTDKHKASVEERQVVATQLQGMPQRIGFWASQPCRSKHAIFNFVLCVEMHQQQSTAAFPAPSIDGTATQESRPSDSDAVNVEVARTVISRLNDVYLPLLLGFLGAHAYILRRMSREITERAFARGSSFNHIVRVGLGALAGLASTWLLTPETVGGNSFKALPVWALAFVAGYGIELVFAFMDRVIGAFTGPEGSLNPRAISSKG